jgi:hypothetical protein
MVHRRDHPLSYAFPAEDVGGLPMSRSRRRRDTSMCRDAVDTWLEEGASSFTIRRTRTTVSTADGRTAGCASPSRAPPSSIPRTR